MGALAKATTASVRVDSDDGAFVLDLVAGGEYELVLESPRLELAATRILATAPASGQELVLGDVLFQPALALAGRIAIPSRPGMLEGVHIMLLCADCETVDAERLLAESITAAAGDFVLYVPDPGRE